jgi:hypothetical protein
MPGATYQPSRSGIRWCHSTERARRTAGHLRAPVISELPWTRCEQLPSADNCHCTKSESVPWASAQRQHVASHVTRSWKPGLMRKKVLRSQLPKHLRCLLRFLHIEIGPWLAQPASWKSCVDPRLVCCGVPSAPAPQVEVTRHATLGLDNVTSGRATLQYSKFHVGK